MATAEAKALGLRNRGGTDGFIGFNTSSPWTFDANNRDVAGKFDFIGVAEHEIVRGPGPHLRSRNVQQRRWIRSICFAIPGAASGLSPGNGQYFSINGGITNLDTFNGTGGGDLGDWARLYDRCFQCRRPARGAAADLELRLYRIGRARLRSFGPGRRGRKSRRPWRRRLHHRGRQLVAVPEPGIAGAARRAMLGLGFGPRREPTALKRPTASAGGRGRIPR